MKKILITLAALLAVPAAFCQLITPVSVTGSGSYNNSASLIIDGVIPAEYTWWTSGTNAYWNGTQTAFTVDLGGLYHVDNVLFSVDNNDSYQVDYSVDGVNFTKLFANGIDSGVVTQAAGGMDTEVSYASAFLPAVPYETNTTMAFSPVDAKFLRIEAVAGDNSYAIGELEAFGTLAVPTTAVPEPSTYGMIGAAALIGLVAIRRRARK